MRIRKIVGKSPIIYHINQIIDDFTAQIKFFFPTKNLLQMPTGYSLRVVYKLSSNLIRFTFTLLSYAIQITLPTCYVHYVSLAMSLFGY